MPKAKKKKSSPVKKTKKLKAKKARKPAFVKTSARRGKKEVNSDVIFDSQIGKTDALFVSNPEPQQIDPAIDEALKELDALEKEPQPQPANPPSPAGSGEAKKSFWQRLFNRK